MAGALGGQSGCCECAMPHNAMAAIELANGASGPAMNATAEYPSFLEVMEDMRHLQGDMCCPCGRNENLANSRRPNAMEW
eukprot:CAMPEP_0197518014 /NCGR_PEP_ID=MMETSP1318-20131121/3112_1 /TAXON_ID=552666 /ORGANISM="Partenskyella glossopodia, Strain RCC365" /LENGTH=79 /DNA_ID=CAMNT_0043068027 /DNA_START=1188 /DNA_END=1424 /DNA_ORIENTATION=+